MTRACVEVTLDDFATEDLVSELIDRGEWECSRREDWKIVQLIQDKKYKEAVDLLWARVEDDEAERRAEKYREWMSTNHGHMTGAHR